MSSAHGRAFHGSKWACCVYCAYNVVHITTIVTSYLWAARYNNWLLNKLTPKGVVFSFLFFSYQLPNSCAVCICRLHENIMEVGWIDSGLRTFYAIQTRCQQRPITRTLLQLPSSFGAKHSAVNTEALQCEQLTSQRGLASGSSTSLQHPCSCH